MADKPKKDEQDTSVKTLTDEDIVEEKSVGRRFALRMIGGLALGSAVASVLTHPAEAEAQRRTGRTNSDPDDRPGYGRTGVTDSDPSDGSGYGRGRGGARPSARRRTGATDRDSGPGADGAGFGVCAQRGHTDSDSGGGSDGAGRGRGPCH